MDVAQEARSKRREEEHFLFLKDLRYLRYSRTEFFFFLPRSHAEHGNEIIEGSLT